MSDLFEIVGVKPELAEQQVPEKENRWYDTIPWLSVIILILIVGGCLFCNRIMTKDPSYMDLKNYTIAPCKEFLFGTDTMGRDIFSMIWYGGRQSLFIGIAATVISTGIAIVFGTVSGMAPDWLDMLLMRATEILLSIPNLLTVIFLQAILGKANVFSLSFVIGITSWMSIAKIIRDVLSRSQSKAGSYVRFGRKCFFPARLHMPRNLAAIAAKQKIQESAPVPARIPGHSL
jgi:peptide/nickel transport system permease protein